MNITETDLIDIRSWAARKPEIRSVHLYGSRARGDNREDSDIDLAIRLFQRPNDSNMLTTWIWCKHLWAEKPDLTLSHPIHMELYEEGENLQYVGPGVERDGILLFHRQ
ncbi:nucleotidyltransferase domain-containing protein [Amorphus sp. 3PC139-8]|uniref:nucleotidyltransferase domain-containing protein n=1 Tax=Amorphus sp. 3PC139-8 TaxID=2735676 RepID=UPI00345D6D3B